jgi:hypothetical protein|tara:strand:- start:259 stop:636 length:378 start_codon:yes stop_codon:yes gene_type:complete
MENPEEYKKLTQPFNLLEIDAEHKTITQLCQELNFRAKEEYLEHCYRSKKSYNRAMFTQSIFYKRFIFFKVHLRELSYWLYENRESMPEELLKTMKAAPDYHNPWGVNVRKNLFRNLKISERKKK